MCKQSGLAEVSCLHPLPALKVGTDYASLLKHGPGGCRRLGPSQEHLQFQLPAFGECSGGSKTGMQAQDETFASTLQGLKHWVNQKHLQALMALPRLSWDTHLPMGTGASCSSTSHQSWLQPFFRRTLHFIIPFLQSGIGLLTAAGLW